MYTLEKLPTEIGSFFVFKPYTIYKVTLHNENPLFLRFRANPFCRTTEEKPYGFRL
jgi:hypothetical protein